MSLLAGSKSPASLSRSFGCLFDRQRCPYYLFQLIGNCSGAWSLYLHLTRIAV